MSFGFGSAASKPATAGTTTGFGGGASTGFGGGFGAATKSTTTASTTGFGAASGAPAASGFGSTGFGAPTTTGFGAPATSGFGAPKAGFGAGGSTGFGTGTGFGAAAGAGFGAPSTGFGAAPSTGFAQNPYGGMPAQPQPGQPYTFLPSFVRQSALANYMHELDAAYNALHPKCRFRTFVYNMCGSGQGMDAIQRDRYITFMNGGSIDDGDYMVAMHKNPDPEHLYPAPVHFNQEMVQRIDRQKEVIQELTTRLEEIMQDVHAVIKMDRSNKQQMRELRLEEAMLRRRWYALLQKTETLRLFGVPIEMESLLAHRAETVRQQIAAPGSYMSVLERLQPALDEESSQCAAGLHASGAAGHAASALASPSGALKKSVPRAGQSGALAQQLSVEPEIMKSWLQMASNMQNGVDTIEAMLKDSLSDMRRIRERIRAAALN